ncbi:MAG: hypothetical protein AB7P76_03510 [Candidatus Melainabacteria bacterium]
MAKEESEDDKRYYSYQTYGRTPEDTRRITERLGDEKERRRKEAEENG